MAAEVGPRDGNRRVRCVLRAGVVRVGACERPRVRAQHAVCVGVAGLASALRSVARRGRAEATEPVAAEVGPIDGDRRARCVLRAGVVRVGARERSRVRAQHAVCVGVAGLALASRCKA